MKVKTSELTRQALNWATAKAEGHEVAIAEGSGLVIILRNNVVDYFDPAGEWGWGGPIIEREKISIRQWTNVPTVHAYMPVDGSEWSSDATSPLIAAMRCYVASKLGDEVDVPEELCA